MSKPYFHLDENRESCGPFSAEELRDKLRAGEIQKETLASATGGSDWMPVGHLLLPPAAPASDLPPPAQGGRVPSKAPPPNAPLPVPALPAVTGASRPAAAGFPPPSVLPMPPPALNLPPAGSPRGSPTPSSAGREAALEAPAHPEPLPARKIHLAPPNSPVTSPSGTARSRRGKGLVLAVMLVLGTAVLAAGGWYAWWRINPAGESRAVAHPQARWYLFGHHHGTQQAAVDAAFGVPSRPDRADLAYALKVLGVPNPPPPLFALCFQGYEDAMQKKPARYRLPDEATEDGFPTELEGLME